MNVNFFYDVSFVRKVIGYLLIPLLIFIIICSIILLVYSKKHKDHEDPIYKYKMNLFSILISILLVSVFLAVLIGFSLAFKKQMDANEINTVISYFVIFSPMIPAIAILVLFFKTFKVIKNKPRKAEILDIGEDEDLKVMVEEQENDRVKIVKIDHPEKEEEEEKGKEEIELL